MQPRPVRKPHEFISHMSHSSPNVSGGHTQWPVSGSHTCPGLSQGSHSANTHKTRRGVIGSPDSALQLAEWAEGDDSPLQPSGEKPT